MQIFSKKFSMSKVFERKPILIISTFLHLVSLVCSLIFNNNLGFANNNKIAEAPFNFFWEWITVFWCVWSSILTCFYNYIELKGNYKKNERSKRQETFGLVVAVGNLISILIFTTYLPDQLSKDIPRGPFWWIYSVVWHYITFPLSLFYFCKFVKVEEKKLYRRKIFWLLVFQPFIYLLANLFRARTAEPTYLNEKRGWKKFLVPYFEWAEKGELLKFLIFFLVGIFACWLLLLLLIKVKKHYFPRTIAELTAKKKRKAEREREREIAWVKKMQDYK